jgi:hypothetical protein
MSSSLNNRPFGHNIDYNMPLLAVDILVRLVAHPSLTKTLQFTQVQRFLEFTRRIWPEIVGKKGVVPDILPSHTAAFLSAVLGLSMEQTALSWIAFSDMSAVFQTDPIPLQLDDAFRLHDNDNRIGISDTSFATLYFIHQSSGAESLNPPSTTCPRPECCNKSLSHPSVVESRLYTLHRGILPVFSQLLYCRGEYKFVGFLLRPDIDLHNVKPVTTPITLFEEKG